MDKLTSVWLDSAVPSSLHDMDRFQDVIAATKDFAARLTAIGFSNLGALQEWTENAPRVWLSKCREAALDSVRVKLSGGLGAPTRVEKVEKQMVSQSEGKELVASGATASADDHGWGAWDDGEQAADEEAANGGTDEPTADDDDGTDAWGWGEEGGGEEPAPEEPTEETKEAPKEEPKEEPKEREADDEDDPSEAWGWGDEAAEEVPEAPAQPKKPSQPEPQTRELILRETYSISSLPQPVLDLIFAIVEDGATLTQDTYAGSPVAAQAAGLFSLPTLALAVFRAVSPYYYAPELGGHMYALPPFPPPLACPKIPTNPT